MKALVVSSFRSDIAKSRQGYNLNVLDTIRALKELGMDVTVIAFGNGEPDIDVNRDLIPIKGKRASLNSFRSRRELYKRLTKYDTDLLYVHHSPDFPSSLLMKKEARRKILHMHDLLSDVATGMFGSLGAFLSLIYKVDESLVSKYTDVVVVPSEEMGEIVRNMGFKKIGVAYNWPGPVDPKESKLAEEIKKLERPIFVYVGTIQPKIRGLEEILRVVREIGGTVVAIGKKESDLSDDVVYFPPVSRDVLIGAIRYADFGVIGKTISYALPAKIFDYMYALLPIVTSKKNSAIIKLLNKANRPYVTYEHIIGQIPKMERPKEFPSRIKPRKEAVKDIVETYILGSRRDR